MFSAIKRHFAIGKAYRNMSNLWTDFLSLYGKYDCLLKLNAFCEYFVASFNEFLNEKSDLKLDDIFGDCSGMLETLMEFVGQSFEELNRSADGHYLARNVSSSISEKNTQNLQRDRSKNATRALRVIEIILRHEKYRTSSKSKLLPRIIQMLQPDVHVHSLLLVLQILCYLSNETTSKTDMIELDGFPKIFALLVNADDELQKAILKTFHTFLALDGVKVNIESSKFSIPKWGQSIMSQLPQSAIYPIQRLFYSSVYEMQHQQKLSEVKGKDTIDSTVFETSRSNRSTFLPPSFEDVANILGTHSHPQDPLSVALSLQHPASPKVSDSNSSNETKTLKIPSSSPSNSKDDLQNFIVSQGVMKSLLESLCNSYKPTNPLDPVTSTSFHVQMDMIGTLCQLLIQNSKNQQEFRRIQGYSLFTNFLVKCDAINSTESIMFIDCLFCSFYSIAIDGSVSRIAGNTDALQWLLELIYGRVATSPINDNFYSTNSDSHYNPSFSNSCSSENFIFVSNAIQIRAIKLVYDLVTANPLNAALIKKVGGVSMLLSLVDDACNGSPTVEECLQNIDSLLQFIAVSLTFYDHDIPSQYISMVSVCGAKVPIKTKLLLCKSVANFARHFGLFGIDIHEKLVDVCVSLLQEFLVSILARKPIDCTNELVIETKITKDADVFVMEDTPGILSPEASPAISRRFQREEIRSPFDIRTITNITSAWTTISVDDMETELALSVLELLGHVILTQSNSNGLDIAELISDDTMYTEKVGANKWSILALHALQKFEKLNGLDILVSIVHPSLPLCISEMSLYLLSRFTLLGSLFSSMEINFWSYMVTLIRQTWFPYSLRLLIFKTTICVLNDPFSLYKQSGSNSSPSFLVIHQCKAKFGAAGGILAFVHILDECAVIHGLYSSENKDVESVDSVYSYQKVSSYLLELSSVSLLAIFSSVRFCDLNKLRLNSSVGFDRFSEIIKRTSVPLDHFLFNVLFELATNTPVANFNDDALTLYFSSLNEIVLPSNVENYLKIHWSESFLPRLISLSTPERLFATGMPCVSALLDEWHHILFTITSANIGASLTSFFDVLQSDRSSSSTPIDSRSLISSGSKSPVHTPVSGLVQRSRSENTLTSLTQLTPSPKASITVKSTSRSQSPFRSNLSSPRIRSMSAHEINISEDFILSAQTEKMVEPDSNVSCLSGPVEKIPPNFRYFSLIHLKNENYVEILRDCIPLPKRGSRIHNPASCLMVMMLIPHASLNVQIAILKHLGNLLKTNPANKRSMSAIAILPFVLKLCPRFHEDIVSSYLDLAHTVGSYDISASEIRLLFAFALLKFDTIRNSLLNLPDEAHMSVVNNVFMDATRYNELQMQMLYMIGRISERTAPLCYFNVDNWHPIPVKPFDRFPSGKYGYTFSCWIKLNSIENKNESVFLSWYSVVESDLSLSWNNSDVVSRICESKQSFFDYNFCSKENGCVFSVRCGSVQFEFDECHFSDSGNWHHLVIAHSNKDISVFLDGSFKQKYASNDDIYLPYASSDNSLFAVIAPHAPQMSKDPFCGEVGLIYFLEGVPDEKLVKKLFDCGSLYEGEITDIGFTKVLHRVNPSDYFQTFPSKAKEVYTPLPIESEAPSSTLSALTIPPTSLMSFHTSFQTPRNKLNTPFPDFFSNRQSAPNLPTIHSEVNLGVNLNSFRYNNVAVEAISILSYFSGAFPSLHRMSIASKTRASPSASLFREDTFGNSFSPSAYFLQEASSDMSLTIMNSNQNALKTIVESKELILSHFTSNSAENEGELVMTSLLTAVAISSSLRASNMIPADYSSFITVPESIDIHQTRSIKLEIHSALTVDDSVIGSPGDGIFLCFPFLSMDSAQQVASLRILGSLLEGCPLNQARFESVNGFLVIGHLLTSSVLKPTSRDLSVETFDLLLSLTSNSGRDHMFSNLTGLQLILDLCRQCDASTRSHVLSILADACFHSTSNVNSWRMLHHGGMLAIVDLLRLSPNLLPSLLIILNQMLKLANLEEILILLQFLIADQHLSSQNVLTKATNYEFAREKAAVSELIRVMWTSRPDILVCWHESKPSFQLLFLLMDHVLESIRIDCIKLTGMLLERSSSIKSSFVEIRGFDLLAAILIRYNAPSNSLMVGETLIRFAVGLYKCDPASKLADKKLGAEEDKIDYSKHIICHVETFQVVFALLSASPLVFHDLNNQDFHVVMISQIDLLCDRFENMEKLLECSEFWAWVRGFWSCFTEPLLSHPAYSKLLAMLERLLLFDIGRENSKIINLRKVLVDSPIFLIVLIKRLVSHFTNHPTLESKSAKYSLTNLYSLLFKLEESVSVPVDLLISVVTCVNLIASHNTPEVRKLLSSCGLISVRELFILHASFNILNYSSHDQLDILLKIPFDSVVANRTFREQCSVNILALFHFICHTSDEHQFKINICLDDDLRCKIESSILELFRHQFSLDETLLIHLAKIVQDPTVFSLVFPHIELQWESSFCMPSFSSVEHESKAEYSEETLSALHEQVNSPSAFVEWYKSPNQTHIRKAITDRIIHHLKENRSDYLRDSEKLSTKRTEAIASRSNFMVKRFNTFGPSMKVYLEETLPQLRDKMLEDFAMIQQSAAELRLNRAEKGENSWNEIRNILIKTGFVPIPGSSFNEVSVIVENENDSSELISLDSSFAEKSPPKTPVNKISFNPIRTYSPVNSLPRLSTPGWNSRPNSAIKSATAQIESVSLLDALSPAPGKFEIPAFPSSRSSPIKVSKKVSKK